MSRYSKRAREFISEEIGHLVREKGYPQSRAVAAALSVARRKGFKVPPRKMRSNPTLMLVNPPAAGLMGTAVYEIGYRHANGKDYKHTFKYPEGVELRVLSPYKVLIFGRHAPIVDMFREEG